MTAKKILKKFPIYMCKQQIPTLPPKKLAKLISNKLW